VKLATFNVLHGRSLDDGQVSTERLREACASLGVDVLCLQEVDRGQPRSHRADQTAEVAEAMGAAHWKFVPAIVGEPGGRWRPATAADDASAGDQAGDQAAADQAPGGPSGGPRHQSAGDQAPGGPPGGGPPGGGPRHQAGGRPGGGRGGPSGGGPRHQAGGRPGGGPVEQSAGDQAPGGPPGGGPRHQAGGRPGGGPVDQSAGDQAPGGPPGGGPRHHAGGRPGGGPVDQSAGDQAPGGPPGGGPRHQAAVHQAAGDQAGGRPGGGRGGPPGGPPGGRSGGGPSDVAGGDHAAVDQAAVDRAGDGRAEPAYGVALVSRRPVRAWHTLRLKAAPGRWPVVVPGGAAGKGGVVLLADEPRAAVAADFGDLVVASVHLSFVPGYNLAQLRQVVRWLALLNPRAVLLGDLNVPAPLPRLASGWRELARVKTFPAERPKLQVDHALAHGALPAPGPAGSRLLALSDHRALVVQLGSDAWP